jgi:predicted RNA-binding protein with PIN domain
MAKPITSYFWIVDGHNLVLNVPELSRLYNQESKKAARQAAEKRLEDLAGQCPEGVQLVFDGETFAEKQPGGRVAGALSVTFVDPPAEADDWIVQLAKQAADAGRPVAVSTSDRGLLARLSGAAMIHRMGVEAFWRESGRLLRQMSGVRSEKPEPESTSPSDVAALEREMHSPRGEEEPTWDEADLREEPTMEPERSEVPAESRTTTGGSGGARRASEPPPPPRPEPTWQEKLLMKKEVGRRRQERRLRRMKGN